MAVGSIEGPYPYTNTHRGKAVIIVIERFKDEDFDRGNCKEDMQNAWKLFNDDLGFRVIQETNLSSTEIQELLKKGKLFLEGLAGSH